MAKSSKEKQSVEIDITPKTVKASDLEIVEDEQFFRAYANFIRASSSPYDFTLYFAEIDQLMNAPDKDPRLRMKGSVTMSFVVANQLAILLRRQLDQLESIPENPSPPEDVK